MVAISRSDNLNPQHWKRVRALTPKNTAPIVKESVPTFEAGEAKETEYVMVPAAHADQLKGYVPIDRLTAQKILEQAPALQASANSQDHLEARSNSGSDIGPNVAKAQIVPPVQHTLAQSTPLGLTPVSLPEQLSGYEPRFFLKEDGKDYSEEA